jgi:hypothetical protein
MIKDGRLTLIVIHQKIWPQSIRTQPGVDGPYRNSSIDENLALFEGMKNDFQKEVMLLKLIWLLPIC